MLPVYSVTYVPGLYPQGNGRFDVRGARCGDGYGDGGHERHEYGSGSERTRI